ncbi:hypothetical protein MSHOH_2945 [Methanosarcina horonobensis HB-1 = JCM 15518]|uniref:Uncharacterized protein n=1 Tax=Methanosarcina horonobensis HB-1 = JCM 15518 TaxID=1434110 RepID=A0A0E3SHU3_9EURY|nr:hypothetical protein MSHOH_2945 [Methanosarcina horonobensis HB-1 = JCM 15518]
MHVTTIYGSEQHCPFDFGIIWKGKCLIYCFCIINSLIRCSVIAINIDTTVYCSTLDRGERNSAYVIISKADSAAQSQR